MKEYVFERISCENSKLGAKTLFSEHREKINEYASKGFRYVGWIPVLTDGYGHIKEIDLIFEPQND